VLVRRWGLVLPGCLGGVGLVLGRVGTVGGVLGRGCKRCRAQWLSTGVAEVVPGTGWDGALVTGLDRVGMAVEVCLTGSADEGEDLVGVLVDLVTDLTTGGMVMMTIWAC
jgi:hypothetical protein